MKKTKSDENTQELNSEMLWYFFALYLLRNLHQWILVVAIIIFLM